MGTLKVSNEVMLALVKESRARNITVKDLADSLIAGQLDLTEREEEAH